MGKELRLPKIHGLSRFGENCRNQNFRSDMEATANVVGLSSLNFPFVTECLARGICSVAVRTLEDRGTPPLGLIGIGDKG